MVETILPQPACLSSELFQSHRVVAQEEKEDHMWSESDGDRRMFAASEAKTSLSTSWVSA